MFRAVGRVSDFAALSPTYSLLTAVGERGRRLIRWALPRFTQRANNNREVSPVETQKNVFGEPLEVCSLSPRTGVYRTGCCHTGPEDFGIHTVCTEVTAEFLAFSKARGNDLSTPRPEFDFPGL